MYLCSNLLFLRKRQKLTQEAIAELLGLTQQTIALYESGDREPTLCNLLRLSKFFDVTTDDLLTKDLRPAGLMLSKNIKYLRKSNKYRQEDIAAILMVDRSNISHYEAGEKKPTIESLVNLSEFFGITVDDLLKKDLEKEGI